MRHLCCLICVIFTGCINPIQNDDYFESEVLVNESEVVGNEPNDIELDTYFNNKTLILKISEPPKPVYQKSSYQSIESYNENIQPYKQEMYYNRRLFRRF